MKASQTPESISQADIEFLDEFLASESARQNCFGISDLDGFLTGVAIGQELIRPSEWLPIIWGGKEPAFDDTRIAERVTGLIIERYNYILQVLDIAPDEYAPWFWEKADGTVIAMDWAEGFLDAVNLRPDAWRLLLDEEQNVSSIMPIAALWPGSDGHPVAASIGGDTDKLIDELSHRIPQAVIDTHRFWKTQS